MKLKNMNYKKLYAIAFFALIAFQLSAQDKIFTLTGKLANVPEGSKIYLYAFNPKIKKDSSVIKNGRFEFKGSIASPIKAQLFLPHGPKPAKIYLPFFSDSKLDFFSLYLEEGLINVNGRDSVKNLVVSGSQVNTEDQNLARMLQVYHKQIASLRAAFAQAPPEKQKDRDFVNASNAKWGKIDKEIEVAKFRYAKENPDSYISLNTIYELVLGRVTDFYKLDTAYRALSSRFKNTFLADDTESLILAGIHTNVGEMARDFSAPDANGKSYKLSDFRGKYVLLDFWASWCGPCRKESPFLVKAYEKFKDKNFTIVGVSVDKMREPWLKAIESDKMSHVNLNDLKGPGVSEAAVLYRVEGIPASYLIDPTGKIVAKDLRGEALDKKLMEIFRQSK